MKQTRIPLMLTVVVLTVAASIWGINTRAASAASAPQAQAAQPPATVAEAVDRAISSIEKQVIDVAEAMPEDKYNFSPEGLNIPGADYKGVRTFAVQCRKHYRE